MKAGCQNPDTGATRGQEEMAQPRMDASSGLTLLDTGHEEVKKKPGSCSPGLCNRKYYRVHFSMPPKENFFFFLAETQSGSYSTH